MLQGFNLQCFVRPSVCLAHISISPERLQELGSMYYAFQTIFLKNMFSVLGLAGAHKAHLQASPK